ncbi:carbon-nitrogen hydrolase family protein [Exiguobacterium flavidum]|uniref:carbon-nitrogen hydrolase family protein n=1 Tax=Exiguobacterium flavidum TaxID=2184695 RepID=UPI000DF73BCA|nr:carbon-nitrogen hydrolase family protein [Exiguobacterium flavidum]
MKILIGQPIREKACAQLIDELRRIEGIDLVLYPEGYCSETDVEVLQELARAHGTEIVLGSKNAAGSDQAMIIGRDGNVLLTRPKTPESVNLYSPSTVEYEGGTYGYLLCREIFLGLDDLPLLESTNFIFNPIGVGMFSEEQYEDWTNEAKQIAVKQNSWILGTSHADGSYRNCGFSIPIAYCFDENGDEILLSKNDTRTRIIDTVDRSVRVVESPARTDQEEALK